MAGDYSLVNQWYGKSLVVTACARIAAKLLGTECRIEQKDSSIAGEPRTAVLQLTDRILLLFSVLAKPYICLLGKNMRCY